MRKASQDGGDSYSITSGVENELKKPLMSLLKNKKGSLKRKPPSSSKESDDTVVETLLNKDKEKQGTSQCAKFFTKPKTEANNDKIDDKSKLINDNKIQNTTSSPIITSVHLLKENTVMKSVSTSAPIHNYMNTNVFNSHSDGKKVDVTTKSQILVEIDSSKPSGYSPSPLIFTTAKIHTDGNTKHMEPVQVTPVPILSTVEASLSKSGSITTNEKKVMNASNGVPLISTVYNTNIINKNDTKPNTQLSNTATAAQTKDTGKIIIASQSKTPSTSSNNTVLNQPQKSSNNIISTNPNTQLSNTATAAQIEDTDKIIITSQSKTPSTSSNNSVLNQPRKSSNDIISTVQAKSVTEPIANSQQKDLQSQKPAVVISSSTLEQTETISNQTKKPVSQSQPVSQPQSVSSTDKNQTNQNTKQPEKSLSEKQNTNFESVQIVDFQPKGNSNKIDTSSSTTPMTTSNTSKNQIKTFEKDVKPSQMPKNSSNEDTSKGKKAPDITSSIKAPAEKAQNSSVKIVSSSIKQPISTSQPKTNNVSKETDKTPKTSANEAKLTISKHVQNTTANTSFNKATEKPTTPVVSVASTGGINIKIKSQPSTVKPTNTSKTENNPTTSSLPKSLSTTKSISLAKTVSAATPLTVTSKSTTLTKPISKVTTVTSQKPSGINIASIKQPAASTVKLTSASSSVAKTSATSSSSNPVVTTKSSTSKPTQVSSKSEAKPITVTPTTTAAASTNGIAKPDIKNVTKPNDHSTSKVSKA